MQYGLLSAAVGQRPRNYSSCCCWIFLLIYALSTSTTMLPPFFKYCKLSLYLSIYHSTLYLSINPSSSIFICQSINRPLPFPKNQYIIAADPGPGIGLVFKLKGLKGQPEHYLWLVSSQAGLNSSKQEDTLLFVCSKTA